MHEQRTFVIAAGLVALIGFAGCGGDEASEKTASAPAPETKPAAATPTADKKDTSPGLIAYAAEGNDVQLHTIHPDGSGDRQITHVTDAEAVNPDWSLDGKRLAYEVGSDQNAGIFVSRPDGSAARNVTPKGFQGQPSFSPDGRSIVFERDLAQGTNGIFVMGVDGSKVRGLTRNPFPQPQDACGCDTDPNFSPDGKTITFVRIKVDEQLAALFSIGVDGTGLRRLTPYAWNVAIKHDWSPDGKRIAITTDDYPGDQGSANLVTIRPDGSSAKHLTNFKDGRAAYVGSYSPDGSRIAYRLEDGDAFTVATMSSDGTDVRTVLKATDFKPRFIDWGPAAG